LGRVGGASAALERSGNVTTVRVDARRTLVLNQGRAYVGAAALEIDAAGALAARGGSASLLGNSLAARGRAPAVLVLNGGETMLCDNRVELVGGDNTVAVMLTTPVLVLNANRVRHNGPAISIASANTRMTALGNLTTGSIRLGGNPLPAPWDVLNING
jgi:hypothetical protein